MRAESVRRHLLFFDCGRLVDPLRNRLHDTARSIAQAEGVEVDPATQELPLCLMPGFVVAAGQLPRCQAGDLPEVVEIPGEQHHRWRRDALSRQGAQGAGATEGGG
jgi:hypothetical protein